jgi:AbrB family looped-hinge helix DNA binding protein
MAHETRLGKQGRLVIPAAARHELGLQPGDLLSVRVDKDHLVLERRPAVLARLRERFAAVPSTVSLVDELIADRRAEAARDEARG